MIDYRVLDAALKYYVEHDYDRIEAPWTVTKAVSALTKPPTASDWPIEGKNKVLVASGEQGFLYLYLKGFLPRGRFVTVTPCFREEPFDLTHTKYFMKAELIDTLNVNGGSLDMMIQTAEQFFANQLNSRQGLEIVLGDAPHSYDIEYRGHEIGSYGIRSCPYLDWVYGTGVAEPRFSFLRDRPWDTTT